MGSVLRNSLLLLFLCVGHTAAADDKPDTLLVFMDNFGWGEPGFTTGCVFARPDQTYSTVSGSGSGRGCGLT